MTKEEKNLIKKLIENINHFVTREVRIMEICGTHTHEIGKLGLRSLLNPHIKLISGPGCPVCVTGAEHRCADLSFKRKKCYGYHFWGFAEG